VFVQVISLRDQIKRRQQGLETGKDVRMFIYVCVSVRVCMCVIMYVRGCDFYFDSISLTVLSLHELDEL